MTTFFKTTSLHHVKTVLLWIAIWTMVVIGFRLLAWGIGLACEETVCKII